jgi:hypothetical protein
VKEALPGGGVRLVFPAARNLGSALVVTAFAAIWGGAIWLMLHVGAPIIFPIVFGLFELFFLWVLLDLWLYRSMAEVRSNQLWVRGGLLGIGRKHAIAAKDIKRFTTSENMSSGIHVWKNVVVEPRNGKKRTIAQTISSKLAQQAVIVELNAALRRE